MNAQEVFDKVFHHFIVDDAPFSMKRINPETNAVVCLYRGPNGAKCPAGILISDEEYSPGMEYSSAWELKLPEGHPVKKYKELVQKLQDAHDSVAIRFKHVWVPIDKHAAKIELRWEFCQVARELGLNFPGK